jgi:hypothetical protein
LGNWAGLAALVIAAGLLALVGTLMGCAARPVLVPSASAPAPTIASPSPLSATTTR